MHAPLSFSGLQLVDAEERSSGYKLEAGADFLRFFFRLLSLRRVLSFRRCVGDMVVYFFFNGSSRNYS